MIKRTYYSYIKKTSNLHSLSHLTYRTWNKPPIVSTVVFKFYIISLSHIPVSNHCAYIVKILKDKAENLSLNFAIRSS